MLLIIKYQGRMKQLNLDRRINVQSLQILLGQLFSIRNKIVGLIDLDGQQLNHTRCSNYTMVSDDIQNMEDIKLKQTHLKQSSISNQNNKLQFIDFIYDIDEFQNIQEMINTHAYIQLMKKMYQHLIFYVLWRIQQII
ncbi:unnamed protein product [Paramecium sonneborni]|uniref:Uncharacterized protein n=1 Tax=Paramecium sonneborni TaxID=65129 RepID=A0A8S1RVA7_9CILI|nr:unnamed protein product [Paramecium sonneborni]